MSKLRFAQVRYLAIIVLAWLAVFFVTRFSLLLNHLSEASLGAADLVRVGATGSIYDLVFLLYACMPMALYLLFCPERLWRTRAHQVFLHLMFAFTAFVILFTAVAEWLFWDEFGVRFNFIAVDYLVYSKEVINNILESYPIYPILALLALIGVGSTLLLRTSISGALRAPLVPKSNAVVVALVWLGMAGVSSVVIGQGFPLPAKGNAYQRELASNGPFQFFAAFRNNELDYSQFYATIPEQDVADVLRQELASPNARYVSADTRDVRRVIDNPGPARRLNVVLVTVESLSAEFLGSFGNKRGLTPNLDELQHHSMVFENLYATGTRTDRGLEAITLSIPPTPGRSIVKRIGRETGLSSLGQQFNAQGYDSVFLYGGRGYFDNMNAFFGGNGYRIVDQSSVPSSEMSFQNAWGMADEDLYQQAVQVADAQHGAGRPFFLQLMTTSNHRPYTYPDGRIDIASGSGRDGAVKYTDYAIGRFLKMAQSRPWFDHTVFVIVADHTAGSAGKEDLPVANYHIPMFIYAPRHIPAQRITTLASQIDIAPTLLGLLGMDYTSTFFGRDVLAETGKPGRALIGNYQHLGLFDGRNLAILSPRRGIRKHEDALGLSQEAAAGTQDDLVRRDITYYQGASYAFEHRMLAWRHDGHRKLGVASPAQASTCTRACTFANFILALKGAK